MADRPDPPEAPPAEPPVYLQPYVKASRRHGGGFGSLLWASPHTQEARFDAFARVYDFAGKSVLDVGCGRADFLDFLLSRRVRPARYTGVEAVAPLADAAEDKWRQAFYRGIRDGSAIVRADFVAEPDKLLAGADGVVFSGSLNTLGRQTFYQVIRRAYEAAGEVLVFNFLDNPGLAASSYLNWYERADVLKFAGELCGDVRELADYLDGDRTLALRKPGGTRPVEKSYESTN